MNDAVHEDAAADVNDDGDDGNDNDSENDDEQTHGKSSLSRKLASFFVITSWAFG